MCVLYGSQDGRRHEGWPSAHGCYQLVRLGPDHAGDKRRSLGTALPRVFHEHSLGDGDPGFAFTDGGGTEVAKFRPALRHDDLLCAAEDAQAFRIQPGHNNFETTGPLKVSDLSLLSADWTITYEFPKVPPVEITGKHVW